MRIVRWAAVTALMGAAPPPPSVAPELVVQGDGLRSSSVAGVPATLRIDPGAPGIPILRPELARRVGLKGGMIEPEYRVGPVSVAGDTAVTRIDLGGGPIERRVTWTDRAYMRSAPDAVVGPRGVPHAVVRFQLRSPRPGERVGVLPMAPEIRGPLGLFGGWDFAMALTPIGGVPTRVIFDPRDPTLATAGAARALATAQGGALEGEAVPVEIAFGVDRPVRRMRLVRPLPVGPLSLETLLVRVADFGGASRLPEAGAPPPDPDEVVVTARGKRDRSNDVITVGRDQLERCSLITFDKRRREIRLSCL